jgi:serine/threonine protein kinase
VSGTTAYLAPEQIEGDPVTPQTDECALACVLFETLAGRPPFARDDQLSVVYAHLTEPPPSLSALRPELAPAIDAVLARGLAKAPADRYQSCGALIEAAAAALDAPTGGTFDGAAYVTTVTIPAATRAASG